MFFRRGGQADICKTKSRRVVTRNLTGSITHQFRQLSNIVRNPPAPEPTVVIVERPSEGSAELGSRDFDIAAFNKKPRSWWC
jgi:hypothetical protein